jgi:predicted  nucleic acid-binding Zn-ribbon protein
MDEPKDIVLVRLDKVLGELGAMRAKVDAMHSDLHADMQQIKSRLSALEKQVANQGEAVAAQWENFDNHAERLYKLEHPTA